MKEFKTMDLSITQYFNQDKLFNIFESLGIVTLKILFILFGAGLLILTAKYVTSRLQEKWLSNALALEAHKRSETLAGIVYTFLKISIVVVAFMMVLSNMGINLGPLLATAGLGGLAIGFGAQTIVKDVLSGFFLILEDQIRVGDIIKVADLGGLVEKITLRTVTLRDISGNVHIIPHSSIDKVTNMTRGFSYYVFDIGVAYKEDTDHVVSVVKKVGEELQKEKNFKDLILEPIEILGLDQFADSAVLIKARIKTKPIEQWKVGREMNRRIKLAFDKVGIEIPFPHRTIYYGEISEKNVDELKKAS
jgi:small conductance mechanosensitive channel